MCNQSVGPARAVIHAPWPANINSIAPRPTATKHVASSRCPVLLPMGFQPASSRSRLRKTAKRRLDLADAVEAFIFAVGPALPVCAAISFSTSICVIVSRRLCIAPKAAPGTGQRLIRLQAGWAFDLLATVDDPCCQPDSPSCIYASVMRSARHGQPEPATPLPRFFFSTLGPLFEGDVCQPGIAGWGRL